MLSRDKIDYNCVSVSWRSNIVQASSLRLQRLGLGCRAEKLWDFECEAMEKLRSFPAITSLTGLRFRVWGLGLWEYSLG